jgi:hypothetical protein
MDYLCFKRLQIIMRFICAQAKVCAKLKTWYPINWLHKIIILNSKLPPELSPHSKRISMSSQLLTLTKGPYLGCKRYGGMSIHTQIESNTMGEKG